ncbi:MAG: hypothetical protein E6R08_01225 [Nevskiaceae bacterium]|nr:MAG: hypothetical protein E6R08_01225 [Nevskiaceae bacterium]
MAQERAAQEQNAANQARDAELRQLERPLAGMSPPDLLMAYFNELCRQRLSLDAPDWRDDSFAAHERALDRVQRRYWANAELQNVLVVLQQIRSAGELASAGAASHALSTFVASHGLRLRSFVPLFLKAFKLHCFELLPDHERMQLRNLAHEVRRSVDSGEVSYARDRSYDDALALLFPELQPLLAAGQPGTMEFSKEVQALRATEVQSRESDAVEAALVPALSRTWTRGGGVAFEKWSRYADVARMPSRHARLVRAAYDAREQSVTVPEFVRTQQLTSQDQVRACLDILASVYLLA